MVTWLAPARYIPLVQFYTASVIHTYTVCVYTSHHTWHDALQRSGELSDEVISIGPPVFVHHLEPDVCVVWSLHHEGEGLVPRRIKPWTRHRERGKRQSIWEREEQRTDSGEMREWTFSERKGLTCEVYYRRRCGEERVWSGWKNVLCKHSLEGYIGQSEGRRVLLTIVLDGLGFEHVLVLRSAVCVDDNVWINDLAYLAPTWRLGEGLPTDHLLWGGRERGREGEREGGRERERGRMRMSKEGRRMLCFFSL